MTTGAGPSDPVGVTDHVEQFITHVHAFDDLRMFIGFEEASLRRAAARSRQVAGPGPLHGELYAVKDIVNVAGMATSGGTSALADIPMQQDAPVIARLARAGAVVAAKTNLHELSFGITSNNAVHGAVGNPYDATRIAGGSSGGSAVAVATGLVPFAIAADTGGSARLPAALCGIVGYRPTVGRYPMRAVLPISPTRDTLGLVARTVDLVRTVDAVIREESAARSSVPERPKRGHLRLGLPTDVRGADLDPAVAASHRATLRAIEAAGIELVGVDLAGAFDTAGRIGLTIALAEFPGAVERFLADAGIDIELETIGAGIGSPDVRRIWESAFSAPTPVDVYRQAMRERDLARGRIIAALDRSDVDAIVFPTAPVTARPIGDDDTIELRGERVGTFETYTRFTNLAGVLGLPGISLPSGLDDRGLPIGVELDARPGDDDSLLEIAAKIASLLDSPPPPPPRRAPAGG
ncbi:amidase family protein [Agromyces sp. NPDC049794]|uniref:amidase family protein n=1 Tax=unclassified Agromyces TaxID=2639701 RepID=UPI0033DA6AE3